MDSETLRRTLFEAVTRGDQRRLAQLYANQRDAISASFPDWTRVPAAIRDDPQAFNAWNTALVTVAQHLEMLGVPGPMALLTGGRQGNVIEQWQQAFERARLLGEEGRFDEAHEILLHLLDELKGAQGNVVDDLQPKVFGMLGANRFSAGDLAAAIDWTGRALSECRRLGDSDGVRAYRENLQLLTAVHVPRADPAAGAQLLRCRRLIVKAQDLSDGAEYERSNELLHEVLQSIDAGIHDALRAYRGKALGQLGWNYFRLGDKAHARESTERALEACRSDGDEDGVRIYTVNLSTIENG